jgi:hypothetical protein
VIITWLSKVPCLENLTPFVGYRVENHQPQPNLLSLFP